MQQRDKLGLTEKPKRRSHSGTPPPESADALHRIEVCMLAIQNCWQYIELIVWLSNLIYCPCSNKHWRAISYLTLIHGCICRFMKTWNVTLCLSEVFLNLVLVVCLTKYYPALCFLNSGFPVAVTVDVLYRTYLNSWKRRSKMMGFQN